MRRVPPEGQTVSAILRGRYGRVLVDVFDAEGRNVGLLLIREGLARVYRTSKRKEFLDAQRIAREKKAGIWSLL